MRRSTLLIVGAVVLVTSVAAALIARRALVAPAPAVADRHVDLAVAEDRLEGDRVARAGAGVLDRVRARLAAGEDDRVNQTVD